MTPSQPNESHDKDECLALGDRMIPAGFDDKKI